MAINHELNKPDPSQVAFESVKLFELRVVGPDALRKARRIITGYGHQGKTFTADERNEARNLIRDYMQGKAIVRLTERPDIPS